MSAVVLQNQYSIQRNREINREGNTQVERQDSRRKLQRTKRGTIKVTKTGEEANQEKGMRRCRAQ